MNAVSAELREDTGTSVTRSSATLRWTMRSNSVSAEEADSVEWNWETISRARRFLISMGLTERDAIASLTSEISLSGMSVTSSR